MEMIELKLNMIISKNPHLINSLNRSINHLLFRKYSNIPFNVQKMYVLFITDDYNNFTISNCSDDENIIDIFIPTSLLTIPCGMSFSCLMCLMIYTMIKLLFNIR